MGARRRAATPLLLLWSLAAAGCADTGQARIEVPLQLQGTELVEPFEASAGWQVELLVAELAFGPLYLCAGASAGELCDTARAEFLDSARLDALDPDPFDAGVLDAVTGPVRSYMYDMGLSSVLTAEAPLLTSAARELGGRSLRLEGVARSAGATLPFLAELTIEQTSQTERGVAVIRSASGSGFAHTLVEGDRGLRVRYDARTFFASVDFDALLAGADCSDDGSGALECEPVEVAADSQAWRAIRNDVVAGERPSFEWR